MAHIFIPTFDQFIKESAGGAFAKGAKEVGKLASKSGAKMSASQIASRLSIIGWPLSIASTSMVLYTNIANRKEKIKEKIAKEEDMQIKKAMLKELQELNAKQDKIKARIEKANKQAEAKYKKLSPEKQKEVREKGKSMKEKFLRKFGIKK